MYDEALEYYRSTSDVSLPTSFGSHEFFENLCGSLATTDAGWLRFSVKILD